MLYSAHRKAMKRNFLHSPRSTMKTSSKKAKFEKFTRSAWIVFFRLARSSMPKRHTTKTPNRSDASIKNFYLVGKSCPTALVLDVSITLQGKWPLDGFAPNATALLLASDCGSSLLLCDMNSRKSHLKEWTRCSIARP